MPEEITYERIPGKYKFTVPKSLKGDKELWKIQQEQGYHPAGYGMPHDISEDKDNYYFYCWDNCD